MSTSTPYQPPAPNKGVASLIYFNYMDEPSAQLVQDQLRLSKFMQGYGRVVLLKRNNTPKLLDFSEADERLADRILPPTKTNFFAQIIDLAKSGWIIDLFLFCHGWKTGFGGKNTVNAAEDWISNDDVAKSLCSAATGLTKLPIRIVWGTDCHGSARNDLWVQLGAKAAAGSRYVNFYPNEAHNFIDAWRGGSDSFEKSVGDADTAAVRTVVQTFLAVGDAPASKKAGVWSGCKLGQTVLGDSGCQKEYFAKRWGLDTAWMAGMDGKQIMNHSSYKLIAGDRAINAHTLPRWA